MNVAYAALLKPQRDSRVVVGSVATYAEPPLRGHLRATYWFNVSPMRLQCWSTTTHGDSGVPVERGTS